jgi:predicted DNA-binding protein YlxM (UPF0122 family)
MEHLVQMGILFDFYAPLLTEKQRQIAEAYYFQNLSLAEIAEDEQTSRQAVHDILHRTEELLLRYEARLQLYDGFNRRQQLRETMAKDLQRLQTVTPERMTEFQDILQHLQDTLQVWIRIEEGQEDSE